MRHLPAQNSGVCPVSGLLGAPGTQMGNTAKLLSCRCCAGYAYPLILPMLRMSTAAVAPESASLLCSALVRSWLEV